MIFTSLAFFPVWGIFKSIAKGYKSSITVGPTMASCLAFLFNSGIFDLGMDKANLKCT